MELDRDLELKSNAVVPSVGKREDTHFGFQELVRSQSANIFQQLQKKISESSGKNNKQKTPEKKGMYVP